MDKIHTGEVGIVKGMEMDTEWYVEIDGELHKVYDVQENGIGNGLFYGTDSSTGGNVVRSARATNMRPVAFVSVLWEDGLFGLIGIEGIFKNGKWATHPDNGCPVFKVSERIA